MKVVLFCGGFGTRIREYSEVVPKPMVPLGQQPILWHVMQYYSAYGLRDFILTLGYKSSVIKRFFLEDQTPILADCVVSRHGRQVEIIGERPPEWRVTMLETGLHRNVGSRLYAARDYLREDEMFMANYSDGLTDAPLDHILEQFRRSDKVGVFVAVRPPATFHLVDFEEDGQVQRIRPSNEASMWINGGYFIFRREIFDYMNDGEELVVEPFQRLIAEQKLMAYKHEGFWRPMDTLRDRQALEDMLERGDTPWMPALASVAAE